MRSIISISFILCGYLTHAQVADTLEVDYMPTGLRIGVDAMALGYTVANDQINSQLIVADIDFYRYYLALEYGRYERTRTGTNSLYNTNGSFWRVGADVNFFHRTPEKSVLSLGFRYGNGSFSDKLTADDNDPVYNGTIELTNNNLNADWLELVAMLKVPVWKIWLGYNLRMKFGIDKFEDMKFRPYEVPGYGIAAERTYWEFNYYLMYRISWAN